MNEYITLDLSY